MRQYNYLIRVLSNLPNTNRVHKRVVPVDPSGRREGIKGILTRDTCIGMMYGERIHVLFGRADAYDVRTLLSDHRGLLERCHPQIL